MKGKKTGGRIAGTANKKTREIADKCASEGLTPLEVLLREMRYLADEVEKARRAFAAKKSKVDMGALVAMITELREVAGKAAPYVHPKLQTTTLQGTGKDGEIVTGINIRVIPARKDG